MRTLWIAVLLSACGSKTTKQECPPQKECAKADTDGDFLHADRDQLRALCMGSYLPSTAWPPDYVALTTASGERVPWLLVSSASDRPGDEPTLEPAEWVASAKRIVDHKMIAHSDPPAPDKRNGRQWLNILCDGDEVQQVVVTAALFDKKGAHAVAMRGKQILDKAFPGDANTDEVAAAAIELTNQLMGGPVQLAKHSLGGSPAEYLDVYSLWRKPLALN